LIVVNMTGGLSNQLFQYAAGLRLAHKWNAELKLELSFYEHHLNTPYVLNEFNVKENLATAEDVLHLAKITPNNSLGREGNSTQIFRPEVLDYPDNVYLRGCWESEKYFADIAGILRHDFTLKNPLSESARRWKEKILSCECSVSMHVRHGDFFYSPRFTKQLLFEIIPLDYYYECINRLKQQYKKFTLFVFSNDLSWCKKNFRTDIQTEFVEGEGLKAFEELHLMSLCKHNIIANSTFSWWGAWLNQNPDKKVFVPFPSNFVGTKKNYRHFSEKRNENSPLENDRWIRVPFDVNAQPFETLRPWFSLLLVVNNDAATLVESLNSIFNQNYRYFELIIVDNASSDGSGKILQQAAKTFDNITLIRLHDKISNGAAWNIALNAAQGYDVMFLKGNDRLLPDVLASIYLTNEHIVADVVNSVAYLKADESGDIDIADKKFFLKKMPAFQNMNGVFNGKLDKLTLLRILANNETFFPIATKVFKRKFLEENKIRFNEKIGDDAENLFALDAMFQTDKIIFASLTFYVAP